MVDLSVDPTLLILEHGGERLGLADEPIIDRIKLYDPSFDYSQWRQNVAKKREFINDVESYGLIELYNYMKEHGILMFPRIFENTFFDLYFPKGNAKESLDEFLDILEGEGFEVIDIIDIVDTNDATLYYKVKISHQDEFFKEFMETLLYVNSRKNTYESYKYSSIYMLNSRYRYLQDIVRVLDIPETLSEYLRYAIDRDNKQRRFEKHKEYQLYWYLDDFEYGWVLSPTNGKEWTLEISTDDEDELDFIPSLLSKLKDTYGSNNVRLVADRFHIKDPNVSILLDIDRFYHPRPFPSVGMMP